MTSDDDDATLFVQLSHGDTSALAALYDRHAPAVYALALHVTEERTFAEDLVHDTFLALSRHARRPGVAPPSVLRWLVLRLLEATGRTSRPSIEV